MLSKTCEYAIRAVIFIAQQSKNGRKVNIKEIASNIGSPEHFIAKILQELSRKDLVQSAKGPNGGFYMEKRLMKNSIADIVRAVDGDSIFSGCGLGLVQCSEDHPCPIHHEFKKIRRELKQMLENSKVDRFTEQLEGNLAFLKS